MLTSLFLVCCVVAVPPAAVGDSFVQRMEDLEGRGAPADAILSLATEAACSAMRRSNEGTRLSLGEHSLRGITDSFGRWPMLHAVDDGWDLYLVDRGRFGPLFSISETREVGEGQWPGLLRLMAKGDGVVKLPPAPIESDRAEYGGNEPYHLVVECGEHRSLKELVVLAIPVFGGEGGEGHRLSLAYRLQMSEAAIAPTVITHEADGESLTRDRFGAGTNISRSLAGTRSLTWSLAQKEQYSVKFRSGEDDVVNLAVSAKRSE